MERRELGRSGLWVTRMGLGLASLGRPGYINLGHAHDLAHDYSAAAMETHAHQVLDAAWAQGIRAFDCARSYGQAEQFLSSWLISRQIDPQAVTISSKWGYTYTANWQVQADKHEVKEHSLAVLQRQWGESQALLGDYLRLYQIHSATLDSGVLENRAVLEELARLRNQGVRIGLSVSGPEQAQTLLKALTIRYDGELLFAAAQLTFNLLETATAAAAEQAHSAGVGIIVKEALANGRLTPRNTDPTFVPHMTQLQEITTTHNTTLDAVALAFVLAQPWADLVLSGATTEEQVKSNAAALNLTLTPTDFPALTEPSVTYWQKRNQLPWN